MDSSDGLLCVLVLVLIGLSAFFSATETAYSSLNKIRLRNYVEMGDKKAKRALKNAEDYDKAIAAILIGNNVVNIGSTAVATLLFSKLLGTQTGAAASTVVMTLLVLTFGEILPKSYAKANSEKVALAVAGTLHFVIQLFSPLALLFVKLTNLMGRTYVAEDKPSVTEEELKYIIESIEEEGVLQEQESELIQSALDFDTITVQEILTPRVDMVSINVEDEPRHIIELIEQEGVSRIPVYEKSIDRIIGVVHARDVLLQIARHELVDIRSLLSPCKFVHKTMKISRLLNEFKHSKSHIAIITDDYGGTMGLVTMEDILEELVGEIWDEYDHVVTDFVQTGEDTYEVSGDTNVYDMLEKLDCEEKDFECDYNTVGGWTLEMFEHIPTIGESFTYKTLKVTVKELDDQRVVKLVVQKLQEAPDREDA